jgi:hypothetical protein
VTRHAAGLGADHVYKRAAVQQAGQRIAPGEMELLLVERSQLCKDIYKGTATTMSIKLVKLFQ